MNKDLFDEIARVAYELYEKRGKMHGCHFDDWLEAEKIVLARHAEGIEHQVKRTRTSFLKKTAGETVPKRTRKAPAKRTAKTTELKRVRAPKKKEE